MAGSRESEELEAAQRELDAARRQLSEARLQIQGFGQMAHEIRSLLSGIVGVSGLMIDAGLGPGQREHARRIRMNGEALLSILNDIRDYAEMETQALELKPIDHDPRRIVEEVGELLVHRAHDAGVELVVRIGFDVARSVVGDAARLRQVLMSLATFAIGASAEAPSAPGGDVILRVTQAVEPAGAVRLCFEVLCSRPIKKVGAGLGIAVAKRLVHTMDGELAVMTDKQGSSIRVVLPFDRRGRSTERMLIPRVDLTGKRVLVVDDSAAVRDVVKELAEVLGITCGSAASAAEAAASLRAAAAAGEPYDLALVDAELLDARGAALAAGTRLVIAGYPGQPVAALDGEGVLMKPIRAALLHACLVRLLCFSPERVPAGAAAVLPPPEAASAPSSEPVPGSQSPEGAANADSRPMSERVAEGPRSGRPRILIVDDDVTGQKVAAAMVQRRGYKVDVVGNGRAAVEAVLRGGYAAVLMDCQMPEVDGYAATVEIRRLESERQQGHPPELRDGAVALAAGGAPQRTPILGMTAHVGAGARARCREAGMDDHLSKPLLNEELDRALRTFCPIGRSGAYQAVQEARPPSYRDVTPKPSGQRVGEPDVVAEVINFLLFEAPSKVGELHAAVGRGGMGDLERVARALHERAASLGMIPLGNLAARLERRARAGTLEDAAAEVRSVEQEVERARLALRGPDPR